MVKVDLELISVTFHPEQLYVTRTALSNAFAAPQVTLINGRFIAVLPADNHVHTEWSWEAPGGSMQKSCARAVELGVPSIAFTEHGDLTPWVIAPEFVPRLPECFRAQVNSPDVSSATAMGSLGCQSMYHWRWFLVRTCSIPPPPSWGGARAVGASGGTSHATRGIRAVAGDRVDGAARLTLCVGRRITMCCVDVLPSLLERRGVLGGASPLPWARRVRRSSVPDAVA